MSLKKAKEWQFDGLVGPTHHYAGLAFGNLASDKNAGSVSSPQLAALQGLEKMRLVQSLGMPQAFFPPQKRPIVSILEQLGFGKTNNRSQLAAALENAYKTAPQLLSTVYSSSFMWAANAATVTPSADSSDGKLHLTPANLVSNLHRSLEAEWTERLLQTIFHNESLFSIHKSLPATPFFADEGAANHMRICTEHGNNGVEVFVYGAGKNDIKKTARFPARQQWESGQAIARLHGLEPSQTIMVQQNPNVIDVGVFHHDVIGMNTTHVMMWHEDAFADGAWFEGQLRKMPVEGFRYTIIRRNELPVDEAVATYLFNSQLLDAGDGRIVLVAPSECHEYNNANMAIRRMVEHDGLITTVHYIDVRESMRNGGGPACLRLRVAMTEEEGAAIHPGVILTEERHRQLVAWVKRHYRDRLQLDDLRDVALLDELEAAYAELEEIVAMPGLYAV